MAEQHTADHPLEAIPIEITVHVGRARPLVRQLGSLGKNAVLILDRTINDPVELYVGQQLIAKGQLQEAEGSPGQLAVVLTEVFTSQSADVQK